ncbi:hypothetical protein [Saccharospirillum sp.]|uniref:hypothetical protein n=1 Tax=Saccharospirillum sp. TaxID=2033801 RepID=UPI0034A00B7E
MESRIPLPTDNIYKFYALFGLLLAVFGAGTTIYLNKTTNDLAFAIAVEYETLRADPVRSVLQETRFQVLDKKLEIAKSDKKFFSYSLGVVIGLGLIMMWYGFKKWHTEVQPIQDEIARLTLEKLKREVGQDEKA